MLVNQTDNVQMGVVLDSQAITWQVATGFGLNPTEGWFTPLKI